MKKTNRRSTKTSQPKKINWKSVVHRRRKGGVLMGNQSVLRSPVRCLTRSRVKDGEVGVDEAASEIERGTVCAEGFGRELPQGHGVDLDILLGFADPDEVGNEERICRHSERPSKHDGDVVDGESADFMECGSTGSSDHDFRDDIVLTTTKKSKKTRVLKTHHHPECGKDEVFLISLTRTGFDNLTWKTKRMGSVRPCGCFPVFVQRAELKNAGFRIVKPRAKKALAA